LEYPMESSLLPIHHFSSFDKNEITNTMECLFNLDSDACIWMYAKGVEMDEDGTDVNRHVTMIKK
jgi:hypothetical protein